MLRVEVPDGCELAACVATATSRYAISDVFVLPGAEGKVWSLATDGRALTATRMSGAGEATGPLAGGVLVKPTVLPSRKDSARVVILNGTAERMDRKGRTMSAAYGEGTFPPAADVMPRVASDTHTVIRLNAELLAAAARAVGGVEFGVTLFVPLNPSKPIAIRGEHGVAVVMPIGCKDGAAGEVKAYGEDIAALGLAFGSAEVERSRLRVAAAKEAGLAA